MRLIAVFLIVGALAHGAWAQSCTSTISTCSSCDPAGTTNTWCATSSSKYASGCCIAFGGPCPQGYPYQFGTSCTYYQTTACDTGCIIINVIWSVTWVINIFCVVRFCRARNIQPCCYIVLAVIFHVLVWCCLIPNGRQQLVIVQTQGVPYQAQSGPGPYPQQPYGQTSYGQPYGQQASGPPPAYGQQQGIYNPPAQPVNPYTQSPYGAQPAVSQPPPYGSAPPNPYEQQPGAFFVRGEISKPI